MTPLPPTIPGLIDTHCHLDYAPMADDLLGTLARAAAAGVVRCVHIGCSPAAWARALALAESDIPAGFEDSLCPACGAHPVASIVRIGDAGHGVRYATCSLCACEWHVTRIKCVPCHNTRGISYQGLEGRQGAVHPGVKAETCPECHASLKIVSMEKDPLVDAFADDLATLALDMLVDEAGFHRAGRNLFLFTP